MLCEECNMREAEATVTTLIGGERKTRHLCRECMKKFQTVDMANILAAMMSSLTRKKDEPEKVCPHCGQTLSQFRKTGVLGCAQCYETFKEELRPLFTRIQGRTQHAGRRPPSSPEEEALRIKMEEIRKKMETAVAEERFEMAAGYRDELKLLQQQMNASERKNAQEENNQNV